MSDPDAARVPPLAQQGHQTALHRAAMVGNSEAISALIQGGCALDLQGRDGNTALHEVSWHGFSQCVKLLVKAGADVHARNKAGHTGLHLACQNEHAQSARILLLGGSRPDTKNNVGDTCLHVAARYNHVTMVKILLSALCSVTEKNQAGDTALHVAAALNHKKTVQLLLEAGTDGNARNNAGKTALDKARDQNHRDVALLLARAPQVHRFTRGRTVRKRKDRQRAERKTQSVTRVEILPNKDSGSLDEDIHTSDCVVSRAVIRTGLHQHQRHHKASASPTRQRLGKPREQILDDGLTKRGKNSQSEFHRHNELDPYDGEVPSPGDGKAYKLYTLYRDKDGNIRQAPANGCRCEPLITKLEGQLRATKEEMRSQIVTVQEQVNCRLGRMGRKSKHQMEVLDVLTQERVAAERKDILSRMNQRATEWRVEAEMRQVAVSQDLKRWCMTKIQDIDLNIPANPQYYKLLPSPSVDQSLTDGDLESLPLLSIFSGESSSSLATYVNLLPYPSASNTHNALQFSPDSEQVASRKYFEVKLDRSPDDYENTAVLSHHHHHHHHHHSPGLFLSSTDPSWTHRELQRNPMAAAMVEQNREDCSSSVSSSLSPPNDWDRGHQGYQGYSWHPKKHPGTRIRPSGPLAGSGASTSRTLEFFVDRQPEPTFSQERNHLHAVEVTQCFFETVSTQLERWYERKIQETRQQAEIRAQQDRTELMQRITSLEEELQQLRTNGKAEG